MRVEVTDLKQCVEVGKDVSERRSKLVDELESAFNKRMRNWTLLYELGSVLMLLLFLACICVAFSVGAREGTYVLATLFSDLVLLCLVALKIDKETRKYKASNKEKLQELQDEESKYELAKVLLEKPLLGYGYIYAIANGYYAVTLYVKNNVLGTIEKVDTYAKCETCQTLEDEYFDLDRMTWVISRLDDKLSVED